MSVDSPPVAQLCYNCGNQSLPTVGVPGLKGSRWEERGWLCPVIGRGSGTGGGLSVLSGEATCLEREGPAGDSWASVSLFDGSHLAFLQRWLGVASEPGRLSALTVGVFQKYRA